MMTAVAKGGEWRFLKGRRLYSLIYLLCSGYTFITLQPIHTLNNFSLLSDIGAAQK